MACCEDAELGLKAWYQGIPVLEARLPGGWHPAVDLNLGPYSGVYRRALLREYLSRLAYKSLVHEVWSLYDSSILSTILRALRRRRRSTYHLASDLLAAALIGLGAVKPLLAALGLAIPLAQAASRLPREGYSLRRAPLQLCQVQPLWDREPAANAASVPQVQGGSGEGLQELRGLQGLGSPAGPSCLGLDALLLVPRVEEQESPKAGPAVRQQAAPR